MTTQHRTDSDTVGDDPAARAGIAGESRCAAAVRALVRRREVSSTRFILSLSLFLMLFTNHALCAQVLTAFPFSPGNLPFLLSLFCVFTGIIALALSLVCSPYTTKPLAVFVVLLASLSSYFMDTYSTIIDDAMLRNALATDLDEVRDLLSVRLGLYLLLLGVLPALLICRTTIVYRRFWPEVAARLRLDGLILLGTVVLIAPLGSYYSTFLRGHKYVRYYSNPGCVVYATCKLASAWVGAGAAPLEHLGLDARVASDDDPRKLVIFVVGETARADRFSLNGYERDTNPLLARKPVISFTDAWAYGTSTAISVPYMFSVLDRDEFDLDLAPSTENVLDILKRAGVHVQWRDNNSSSKGVAERIPYRDYRNRNRNPVCDIECRDVGMLDRLQRWIDKRPEGDFFLVLHQMGNHGPAYYKRYPPEFERFVPVGRTNQLQDCTREEIGNAYDNAILYTDYFLSEVIAFLEGNDPEFDVAMLYVSDHGESLGENGIYLHGIPSVFAPAEQLHVPALFWMGNGFDDLDRDALVRKRASRISHDHVAHSILGLMDVETSVYDEELDLFRDTE